MSLRAIIDHQNGLDNGPGEVGFSNFIDQGSIDAVEYLVAKNEIAVISRTNLSLEFTSKGRTFLMEIIDPTLGSSGKSISYKVSSNGLSCLSTYEHFSIRERECDWEVSEPLTFSHSDGIIYSAEKTNRYEFANCFSTLFE